jgi:hypothetical protein
MATVKLRVNDEILDKVLRILGQFDADELEVIEEDEAFLETRKMLHERAAQLEKGEVKTYSIEEVDAILEETIRKYEG